MTADIIHYFDYKSPYAYLAQEAMYEVAESSSLKLEWRPYTLDIPKYLGSAELDGSGNVVSESRNAHQWRRVKYSYMDCRREANQRGMTLRGPRKIYDSSLAHISALYAMEHGAFRRYHDTVFERFWRRELDLEDITALSDVLHECGIDTQDFQAYLQSSGRERLDSIQRAAESDGVFGVPTYVVAGEIFWGAERFELAVKTAMRHH